MSEQVAGPVVTRVRHEMQRRTLIVARVEPLPLGMIRIVLKGEQLHGFTSLGFDDHIKVFFPTGEESEGVAAPMRDFTPRRYDPNAGELWIDFVLHEGGPATSWAAQAQVGQALRVAGPKGSSVIATDGIDTHVLIGDATALPAICRRLEELPSTCRALVIMEVDMQGDRPEFQSQATVQVIWITRTEQINSVTPQIIDALSKIELAPRSFIWVAGESRNVRALRSYFREQRGFDKKWIKAAGYWQQGSIGKHESLQEDA